MLQKLLHLVICVRSFCWDFLCASFSFYLDSLAIPSFIVAGLFGLVVYYEILLSYVLVLLCRFDLTALPFLIAKFLASGFMCFSVIGFVYGFFEFLFAIESGDLLSFFSFSLEPVPLEPKALHILEGIDDSVRDLNGKEALKKEVKDSDYSGSTNCITFISSIIILGWMIVIAFDT